MDAGFAGSRRSQRNSPLLQMKTCPHCKRKTKNFFRATSRKDGLSSWCKKCLLELNKKWRERDPEKVRKSQREANLRHEYGLSPEKWKQMVSRQGGKCKICRKRKKLTVDHCHRTGRVRGLLCLCCNTGLGMFRDNRRWLRRAIKYLAG